MVRLRDENKIASAYKATLKLIHEYGFAGITMKKIARKAGVATGTLYIYFTNKNDLINKLYLHLYEKSKGVFYAGINENDAFKDGLKKAWKNYLFNRIKNHEETVFMEQYYRSPFISKQQKALYEELKKPAYDLLQKGKDNEEIIDVDNILLLAMLLGSLREIALDHVEGRYRLDEKRIEKAFEISWKSLKK